VVRDRLSLFLPTVVISLIVAGLVIGLRSQGVLQPLELSGYDLGLVLRQSSLDVPEVTLIEITEADIQQLGRWPLSDAQLLDALERIAAHHPRVVGLDIYRDITVPPGAAELARHFASAASLIGIFKVRSTGEGGVFSDMVLDADGVIRRGLAFLDDGETVFWAFSLKLALAYLAAEGLGIAADPQNPDFFTLGGTPYPAVPERLGGYVRFDHAGYQYLSDHRRSPDEFPAFSLSDLLADRVPVHWLADRVVILGVNAESVKDSFLTPLSRWPWAGDSQVSGVAVHALLVDQFIRAARGESQLMTAGTPWAERLYLLIVCLAGGAAGLLAGSATRLTVIVLLGVIGITGSGILLFGADFWLPVFPMAAGWTVSAALVTAFLVQITRRERQDLERILSLQVSPLVADEIWRRRDELLTEGALKPQSLTATVMFARATEVIIEHGGMVDDYFGDGIKANFGVPIRRDNTTEIATDASNAVACAVTLARRMAELDGLQTAVHELRFGLHTGELVAATIGGQDRWKYTSVGDTVNVAARLETFAKEYAEQEKVRGSVIVASEETVSYVGEEAEWRHYGAIELKGRVKPVTVHVREI
jgi:adenylate cyclase